MPMFSLFLKHGLIFGGGGNSSNSGKIFTLHKKIFRILFGAWPRTSCRSLFKKLQIFISSMPIFLLMNFIVINQENIQTNLSVHDINTGSKHHLPRPDANIFCFKKSTFSAGIRIFHSCHIVCQYLKIKRHNLKYH